MTPDLIGKARKAGISAGRVYGLTEHPTVSVCDWQAPSERRAATDGIIDEGNEVRIRRAPAAEERGFDAAKKIVDASGISRSIPMGGC